MKCHLYTVESMAPRDLLIAIGNEPFMLGYRDACEPKINVEAINVASHLPYVDRSLQQLINRTAGVFPH